MKLLTWLRAVALCSAVALPSASYAGSPWPPCQCGIEYLELINDGPGPLVIANLHVYEGDATTLVAAGTIYPFARKKGYWWRWIGIENAGWFHLLASQNGAPITPYLIQDTDHHSTTSGRLQVILPRGVGLVAGDSTELVIDYGPDHPLFIDCRHC